MKLAEDIRYVQYICIAYNFNDHQNFICKASVLLRYDDTNNFRLDFEDILSGSATSIFVLPKYLKLILIIRMKKGE